MRVGVDFTHAIMTRFNVARPKRHEPIRLDPVWLTRRFDLFEKYCLPSVAAQTSRDFHWIVYFDAATPQPLLDRIEACRRVFPFMPCFTSEVIGAAFWPRSLEELPGRTPWILTTRFDNDDSLSVDHVARLQAAVARQDPPRRGSLNFPSGFVIKGGRLYALTHLANPFASWLEPWDEKTRTAISINHLKMGRMGPVEQIEGPAAWLQVVHGGNVSNKVRGRRVPPATADGRFPASALADLRQTTGLEVALENLLVTPLRSARDLGVSIVRGHERVVK
jgi:hypothetical protein